MNASKSILFIAVLTSLSSLSAKAGACEAEVLRDANGAFSGCQVKMGDRETLVPSDRTSEAGCHRVCDIMGEVNESKRHGARAVGLQAAMGL